MYKRQILIGPQIAYKKKELLRKAAEIGKPLDSIAPVDYAMGNGAKILKQAQMCIRNSCEGRFPPG